MTDAEVKSLYDEQEPPLPGVGTDDAEKAKPPRRPRLRRPAAGKTDEKTPKPPRPPRKRNPSPAGGRREPLREMGTGIAKGLAFLANNAGLQGASRALMLQSEAAGPAFDQAVRGTVIDRMLQPLARVGSNTKDLGALVALPLSTEAYLRNPSPATQGAFQASLIAALPQIAQARKTAAREQAKLEADLVELAEMFGKDPGERVSMNEVALWLMTGSTDGTIPEPPPPPSSPAEPAAEPAGF